MKAILHTSFIAILGLALGSCSSSSNMASTEYDDMYHSSSDRTIAVDDRSASPSTYSGNSDQGQITNPEYNTNNSASGSNARYGNSGTDEYYTDNYDYHYSARLRRFHSPYVGAGYYDPFYTDYYYYNPRAAYYGSIYSGWYYTSPGAWGYDPFWSPRPWGYSPGFAISIGYGWGRPWYSPYYGIGYGMGWGYPYYSPYAFGGGYGAGYYHGFYDGAMASNGNRVMYGRRGDRSSTLGNLGNRGGRTTGSTGGRVSSGRMAAPALTTGRQSAVNAQEVRSLRSNPSSVVTPSRAPSRSAAPATRQETAPARRATPYETAPSRSGRAVETPAPATNPRRNAPVQQREIERGTPAPSRNQNYEPAPTQRPGRNVIEAPAPNRSGSPQINTPAPERRPNVVPSTPAPQQRNRGIRGIFGGSRQNSEPVARPSAPAPTRQPSMSTPAPTRSSGSFGTGGGGRSSSPAGGGRRSR